MSDDSPQDQSPHVSVPAASALSVAPGRATLVSADGEITELSQADAEKRLSEEPLLTCHTYFTARRLGLTKAPPWPLHFDVLELFAFVRPARFCLPTAGGLARALGLGVPQDLEEEALALVDAARVLLEELAKPSYPNKPKIRRTAKTMMQGGWPWGQAVLDALGDDRSADKEDWSSGIDVWNELQEWQDRGQEGEPGTVPVAPDEARQRLTDILGERREPRATQSDYSALATEAFLPRQEKGHPNIVLSEAGTGIGKTAAYIAPASVWAEKNGPSVWISTYTKNLQRQIDQELDHLFPDPQEKAEKVVIRKGRENYVCLLNVQESVGGGGRGTLLRSPISIGLVVQWIRHTRDGDMVGGDFPAWLTPIVTQTPGRTQAQGIQAAGLTDRRGECIFAACPHYRKCFIERVVRKARHAQIVIANHALVMNQAAVDQAFAAIDPEKKASGGNEWSRHFILDEGHHLFDAADNTFASHLSGLEGAELRRWIRGPEGGGRRGGRGRGLLDRVGDLIGDDDFAEESLRESVQAASALPGPGAITRIAEGTTQGPIETFLALVHQQVLARASNPDSPFNLQCPPHPLIDGLLEASEGAIHALERVAQPMTELAKALKDRLDDDAETLDTATRVRIDGTVRGLERRARLIIPSWIFMLRALKAQTPEEFVDWFGIDRAYGRDMDAGLYRHWIDPTVPFADAVLEPSQGTLITSATLRDVLPDDPSDDGICEDWQSAEIRTGAVHLAMPAVRAHFSSPFDYPAQTKVIVVRDINRNAVDQVASAYRELFKAVHGGALGIFTAINRLRNVYDKIAAPLHEAGLTLYGQHVDAMDAGTLVDLFRAEEDSCLLGTDAVRDGVDVPGRSLRLVVFDRVPWPQPSILHKARREAFAERNYDDMITRLRLKQAFGRLIRRAEDKGIFVILDARMPSRLKTAFPPGVEIERMGLAEAIEVTESFLGHE